MIAILENEAVIALQTKNASGGTLHKQFVFKIISLQSISITLRKYLHIVFPVVFHHQQLEIHDKKTGLLKKNHQIFFL